MELTPSIKIINGVTIEYVDVIHNIITTEFSFWDRIKILFGKKLILSNEIYTKNIVDIAGSVSKPWIPPLISPRRKGGLVAYCPQDKSCC